MRIEMMRVEEDNNSQKPKIRVLGIGGGGNNAINNMIKSQLSGVEFIAANTDLQALSSSLADQRIQLGNYLDQGAGGRCQS